MSEPNVTPGTGPDLIDQCLKQEPRAWEAFIQRYGRLIYSTIHRVGIPPEDQGDVFQSSMIAVFNQLHTLRDRDRLTAWIVGITWRQSIDRIRSRSRAVGSRALRDPALRLRLDLPGDAIPPDEDRIALENAQHAREALDSLSDRCRRLLALMFYEVPPLDYAEIARREGIPIGSLGPTRARCLEKMRLFFHQKGWIP